MDRTRIFLKNFLVFLVVTSCSNGLMNFPTSTGAQQGIYPEQGCTIIYAADENVALAGNNEDFINPYTYVWFLPPEPGKYGRVYFGFNDGIPQGGVNDKGLFFDVASLSDKTLSESNQKPVYNGVILTGYPWDKIMSESANVSDALAILDSYSHTGMESYQVLVGDADGDSMIVDGDTILRKQDTFQIATNFRLSEKPDPPYPCWRYKKAQDILTKADSFSVELFRDILNATYQYSLTQYSNVHDLKNGLIYLYYNHDFENVVVFDVAEEMKKGFHFYRIASLFPSNTGTLELQNEHGSAYETQIAQITPSDKGQFNDYTGDYRVGQMGEMVNIYVEDDNLYYQPNFSLPIELYSEMEDQFFHVFHLGHKININFERDAQGIVIGAAVVFYGEEFHLERLKPNQSPTQTSLDPDTSEIPISPTAVPAPITDGNVSIIPWWGWPLAALVAIAIVAVVRLMNRR